MAHQSHFTDLHIINARSKKGYEAIGRIHIAMSECAAVDGGELSLSWITLDGGYAVEWSGGPFAHEAAKRIIELAKYPESPVLEVSDIAVEGTRLGEHRSELVICGVRLDLRALSPIGDAEVFRELVRSAHLRRETAQ